MRHPGAGVVQGVVVPIGNGFGLAGVFVDVLNPRVAIEGGLQVDLGPPSKQDRLESEIDPRVLASRRGVLST